jgi:tRNA (guanine-N1)-methyltransferase
LVKPWHEELQKFILPIRRAFTTDKHQRVDDEPYGGGVGMLMKPDPIFAAVESLPLPAERREVILLTPQGRGDETVFV